MKITDSVRRAVEFIAEIHEHVHAMFVIALGAGVSFYPGAHDTRQAPIAAGLAMWRGKQQ